MLGLVGLLVGVAGWLGVRGLSARAHLEAARRQVAALQAAVLSGRPLPSGELRRQVTVIRRETSRASRLTGDPVWAVAGRLPAVGCPFRAAAALAGVTGDLAAEVLPPLADARAAMDPATLRRGTTVRLAPIVSARPDLSAARSALERIVRRLRRLPACGGLGRATGVPAARAELVTRVSRLLQVTGQADVAATLLPPMLGADGPRRYLLVVQNDAESRATGGIIGGLGVLTADAGRLRLDRISGNGDLPMGATQPRPAIALSPEFRSRYDRFGARWVWAEANLTPDYPTVSAIYAALYLAGTGVRVDGTISLDPTALSYLVGATRPARLPDNGTVSARALVPLVESDVYARIPSVAARDVFFAAVGRAAYEAVASGAGSGTAVLHALGRAAGEGRLMVASQHPDEQRTLLGTALGGALPRAGGPFLAVVSQNAAGSKLDYWLRRSTDYAYRSRPDGTAEATVTITLANTAPARLPAYVRLREDTATPQLNPGAQNKLYVSVYAGNGAGMLGATLDGRPIGMESEHELGHPVFSTFLTVDVARPRILVVRLWEPRSGRTLVLRPQPMVAPERITVHGVHVVLTTSPSAP